MKINREELKAYAEKGDAELWSDIRGMAKKYGYTLSEEIPQHSDMQRIRNIMLGYEKISLGEGMKLLNSYKNKNK